MKRVFALFFLLAMGICTALFGACSTTATQTPAQALTNLQLQVTKQCTVVQPFLLSMLAMQSQLSPDAVTYLQEASTDLAKGCLIATASPASGVAVTFSLADIGTLVNTGFPSLIKVVDASTLDKDKKAAAEIAITAAQLAISTALAEAQ
jgi:hypothetical protein